MTGPRGDDRWADGSQKPNDAAETLSAKAGSLPNPQSTGFTGAELELPYLEWKSVSESRKPHLCADTRRWLAAWSMWDLACSPMDDDERRRIRYGHYLGWADHAEDVAGTGPTHWFI